MSELTFDQLVEMIAKAKAAGLSELKAKGVYIKFSTPLSEEVVKSNDPVAEVKIEEIFKPISPLDDLSPDEVLYYATSHYDTLQAEKKLREQQLKEMQDV